MSHPSDFFIAGGTLRARAPSYVTRPADQELFEHSLAGEFCYVLTPRQMGKSSLMIRTARRLAEAGCTVAILDLTGIGSGSADVWYLGLLTNIARELRLNIDVSSWWQEHISLAIPQRFSEFLREIVLQQIANPIVIFIDEIDSTLNLDFRDDFFAAIRAIYNARATESAYKRLTFALLGVATPTDLIHDRERTPFNIGRRIVLQEFSYTEAAPLKAGLEACHPGQGDVILRRILHWTNGYPYLTQKLCLAAAEQPAAHWDATQVDELVETTFFSDAGRKDPNFKFVQQRIQESSVGERRQMLNLYRKVYGGKEMFDDDRSQSQNYLELYGLVRVERGRLNVRNDIYRRIFDQKWIEANTPANRDLRWAIGASVAALVVIIIVVINILRTPSPSASLYIRQFNDNAFTTARLEALAGLFNLQDGLYDRDDEQGLSLFYSLNPYEQLDLFSQANARARGREMAAAIRRISLTLDQQYPNDLAIMGEMITALGVTGQQDADSLANELTNWKRGRELAEKGQYQAATTAYSETLRLNPDNLAARYDRASAFIQLTRYGEALGDLNQIIVIAKTAAPPPTAVPSATLRPISGAAITGAPLASPAEGTPTRSSTTTVPSISATSVVTSPLPVGAGASRFISTELIIKTVADTIRGNEELLSYLRDTQNQAAYQDLSEPLGLSSVAQEVTPVSSDTTTPIEITEQEITNLIIQMNDPDAQVRAQAVTLLGDLVNTNPQLATAKIVVTLREIMNDPSPNVRLATIAALSQAMMANPALVTADLIASLLPLLQDANRDIRLASVIALSQAMQSNPTLDEQIIAALQPMRQDLDSRVRIAAASALATATAGGAVVSIGTGGKLFKATASMGSIDPALGEGGSCIEGRVTKIDDGLFGSVGVQVDSRGNTRQAKVNLSTGTYRMCGLAAGEWGISIYAADGIDIPGDEQIAHQGRVKLSGQPGEIAYVNFKALPGLIVPTAVPTPVSSSYDGIWRGTNFGTTTTGEYPPSRFEIEVREGLIYRISVDGPSCPFETYPKGVSIDGNSFNVAGPVFNPITGENASLQINVRGSFSSAFSASGQLSAQLNGVPCASATWNASK
jgi:tetratricopeptide (TPR) repeat protein